MLVKENPDRKKITVETLKDWQSAVLPIKRIKNQELFFPGFFDDNSLSAEIAEYPECLSPKEISFYVFELKQEKFTKSRFRKTYTGTENRK